jgi:uncharacterized protein YndB with AHSA1/START domain
MLDIIDQVNAAHRELGQHPLSDGAEARSVLIRRSYPASVDDVWDACTSPDRLTRWLAPVHGDLVVGGRFQVQGNAGGEILACEPPSRLKVTWALGEGMQTEVEVHLSATGPDETSLTLIHASPAAVVDALVRDYGPGGTIGIGGGWDLALLALHLHVTNVPLDATTWQDTAEAKQFATAACERWGGAVQAAWGSSDADRDAGVAFAAAHFSPAQ